MSDICDYDLEFAAPRFSDTLDVPVGEMVDLCDDEIERLGRCNNILSNDNLGLSRMLANLKIECEVWKEQALKGAAE